MAFLTLNGWTVPVARGGERAPIVIGSEDRSFDGTRLSDRRAVKDSWRFETPGLGAEDATALTQLVLGRGDTWSFDTDLYSGKGLAPDPTYQKAAIRPGISLSPVAAILNQNDVPESKFGAGALTVESACTNLLTEAQRRCTSAAPFALVGGGALSTSNTYKAINTGEAVQTSVYHTRAALGQGAVINPGVAVAVGGDIMNCSAYVMSTAACTVQLRGYDDVVEQVIVSKAITAFVWYRISASFQTDVGATLAYLELTVTAGAAAGSLYFDGLQIVEHGAGSSFYGEEHTWVDGVDATADLVQWSGAGWSGADGITFAAWVLMSPTNYAAQRYLFAIGSSSGNMISLLRNTGQANLAAYITSTAGGATYAVASTAAPWIGGLWRHVALTVGRDPRTGLTFYRHYLDGVADGTGALASVPDFSLADFLQIGSVGGTGTTIMGNGSRMDDVVILPYVLPAAAIAALAAKTYAMPALPRLRAAGDAIQGLDGYRLVEGRVPGGAYVPRRLAGNWHDNAQTVRFELEQP